MYKRQRKLDIGLAPVSFSNRRLSHDKSFSCKIEGKKAIRMLKIKLQADNMAHALDSTMISVSFDGKKTVWAPVGAFFVQALVFLLISRGTLRLPVTVNCHVSG